MASIHLDLPDGVLLAPGPSPAAFASEAKFLLALKLFEMDRLSSGKAAELCDLPRVEFLFRASRMKVEVAGLERAGAARGRPRFAVRGGAGVAAPPAGRGEVGGGGLEQLGAQGPSPSPTRSALDY